MKVAIVNNNYILGGAETVARQLLEGLPSLDISAQMFVSDYKTLPDHPRLMGLDRALFARLRQTRFAKAIEKFAPKQEVTDKSFRALARSDFDVINIHSFHGQYASLESLDYLARHKPVVWTFHRYWGVTGGCDHPFDCDKYQTGCGGCPQLGSWPLGDQDNTAEHHAHKFSTIAKSPLHIVSPSKHLAETVTGSTIGKSWPVTVIPNGVDPDQFQSHRKQDQNRKECLGLDSHKPVLFFANRSFADPIKGWPIIREALQQVNLKDIQIMLAGHQSAQAAKELGSKTTVIDCGFIADRQKMASLLEATDIFLYASSGENYPCVILEAMSAGCCVVSTPCLGVTEQIQDKKTGCLSSDLNASSLAVTLRETLAMSTEGRMQIGQKARHWVEKNASESVMLAQYAQLFSDMTKAKSVGKGAI